MYCKGGKPAGEMVQEMVVPRSSLVNPHILNAARILGAKAVTNDRYRVWSDDHSDVVTPGHLACGLFALSLQKLLLQRQLPISSAVWSKLCLEKGGYFVCLLFLRRRSHLVLGVKRHVVAGLPVEKSRVGKYLHRGADEAMSVFGMPETARSVI